MPLVGLVTVFCPLTTTGAGETIVHTNLISPIVWTMRFVADFNMKPGELVGQRKTTFVPERVMDSDGGAGGAGRVMLNTVPLPELPPADAVP